ncbi:MAG: DEAD/DEAH box helicase [Chitinophagales bacterium]|nr:DEAD/DEAH box helicase [Chitinophagales bacterium]
MNAFEQLGLSAETIKAITELGFEKPTPIQEKSIPALMSGDRDFVGLAQTGTGKTASFGLPLCELVDFKSPTTQTLVLAPTRELCVQITRDLTNFAKYKGNANIVPVYGGASMETQIRQLKKGAQIIVATPGRLIDLLKRKAIKLGAIKFLVLDEADEMLNMGFQEDIDEILSHTPETKKVWLFSATMPSEVRRIASSYMENPFELTMGKKDSGAENISHQYYVIHERDRYAALKRIVDGTPEIFGIVFCRTKWETQDIAEKLIRDGYNADSLHGDLTQQQRDKVMGRYRSRALQLLIATDVAARGIDVNDVSHVVHYNLPDEMGNYTHRSGRTARAGKSGISLSLINIREIGRIRQIEQKLNTRFHLQRVPSAVEVCEQQLLKLVKKIHDVQVNEAGIAKYLPVVYEELKDLNREDLIKRITSLEFNRFLDYYRSAPDLNVDIAHQGRPQQRTEDNRGGTRIFINLGTMDGFDKGGIYKYIIEKTGISKNDIGRIDIQGVCTWFDVAVQSAEQVLEEFRGEIFNDRKVRVDLAEGERKKAPSSGGAKRRPAEHSWRDKGKGNWGGGRGRR